MNSPTIPLLALAAVLITLAALVLLIGDVSTGPTADKATVRDVVHGFRLLAP